jgi:2-polyprenyl-6-methoxyphenol hydroxylase-like FAD-dependent oxidoreductase
VIEQRAGPIDKACGEGLMPHAALQQEAARAGISLMHAKVGAIVQDGESVTVNGIRARYLAAADGLHSPIRASLGL